MTRKGFALIAALTFAAPMAAHAGKPDEPGGRGDKVNEQREMQQEARGHKNGWGDRVSEAMTESEGGNSDYNLGGYLQNMFGGD